MVLGMGTSGLEAAYSLPPYSATTWIHQTPETHQTSGAPSTSGQTSHANDEWTKDTSQAISSNTATNAIDLTESSLMADMQGEPVFRIVEIHTFEVNALVLNLRDVVDCIKHTSRSSGMEPTTASVSSHLRCVPTSPRILYKGSLNRNAVN
jgi:hypothetical protein